MSRFLSTGVTGRLKSEMIPDNAFRPNAYVAVARQYFFIAKPHKLLYNLRLCAEDRMNRWKEALLILGAFVAMACSSSTQWIRDAYVRGDMQWRQDSYGCSLDVSEMTSGLRGVYGNSAAERTWDECMFLKGWREVKVRDVADVPKGGESGFSQPDCSYLDVREKYPVLCRNQ